MQWEIYCNMYCVVFDLFTGNDVMTPNKDTSLISTHEKDLKLSCSVDSLYCVWLLRQGAHVPAGYTLMIDYAIPQSPGWGVEKKKRGGGGSIALGILGLAVILPD